MAPRNYRAAALRPSRRSAESPELRRSSRLLGGPLLVVAANVATEGGRMPLEPSSLVALHLAIQSLQRHDCDRALVGGVNAIVERGGGGMYVCFGIRAGKNLRKFSCICLL